MTEKPKPPPVEFVVSPQFEICYALSALARPTPRLHREWEKLTRARIGPRLSEKIASLGGALWVGLPDVLGGDRPGHNLESLLHGIRTLDEETFRRRMLFGLLHDGGVVDDLMGGHVSAGEVVDDLMGGHVSAGEAVLRLPESKREWLAHIHLFPFQPDSPAGSLLLRLAGNPGDVQKFALDTVEEFWDRAFALTWGRLVPEYHASKERAERFSMAASLREVGAALRVLVEIDDEAGELRAIRGGYRIAFQDLERCYVLPSAFNVERFWTVHDRPGRPSVAFLPFFDHAMQVDRAAAPCAPDFPGAEIDPALVCKVLGDATRLSALALLVARPRNSADLARELGLSKPTVSHHMFLMREAGLIDERALGKSVELSVNRPAIEALSGALVDRLFGATP